jgi:hypothetical protein
MGIFDILGLAGRLWPRLVGLVIAATILLFPQAARAVFREAVEARAAQITRILDQMIQSTSAHERQQAAAAGDTQAGRSVGSNLGSNVSATQRHSGTLRPSNHGD